MDISLVIRGNAIFGGFGNEPFPGAVVIDGNRIKAVIRNGDGTEYIGSDTEVIDAGDRLVMPGFNDNHVHLILAGLFKKHISLIDAHSEEECARLVWEASQDDDDKHGWVMGFQWYHVFWDDPHYPSKNTLDKYFPDRPVFLVNAAVHGSWLNSKGLELAGITKDTPDPFGGVIVRDEDGEPTGFLLEGASALASRFALDFTQDREKDLIRSFMADARAKGITSIADLQPLFHGDMGDLSVYSEMDRDDELSIRIHAAPDLLGDLDQVLSWRQAYNSERLTVNHVKQFIDGVFTLRTALLLDNYYNEPGQRGIRLCDTEAIGRAVPEAHRRGLSVRLHCLGDRAHRMALDFHEEAQRMYGSNACRHTIEHCELIDDTDINRFKSLGIVPSVQPEHIALTQRYAENPYPAILGRERADNCFRYKTLLDTSGSISFGSDCPVVDNDPFLGIYRAITRLHNDGKPEGGWGPAERFTMAEAIRAYTYGSAYSVQRENELGLLREGYLADAIVLDRNPFETTVDEIRDSHIDYTIFDGKIVFERG